jgi:hypothetical protein
MTVHTSRPSVTLPGIVAVAVLACILCDALHELAHALTTLFPLGVRALSISTIGLTSSGSSPIVAAAGPVANLLLSGTIGLSLVRALPPSWRYFGWVFGTVNLLNAAAYLIYSAVFGSGDVAVVFAALTAHWRVGIGIAGALAYALAIAISRTAMQSLLRSGVLDRASATVCCNVTYWSGALVITAGAAFNPVDPWLILSSGAAVGFGAMAGLLLIPHLLQPGDSLDRPRSCALTIGRAWVAAAAIATLLFVGVLGPGIPLTH